MMYEVKGRFKTPEGWQPFKKVVKAHNENFAIEKVYSIIGSNHKVKRNAVKIEAVRAAETNVIAGEK